jgi:hypothetical protein
VDVGVRVTELNSSSDSSSPVAFHANLISQPLRDQLAFLHWALRFNLTRQAYQEYVSKFNAIASMPQAFSTLLRHGWKHYACVVNISTLAITKFGERVPWVSLPSLARFWIANDATCSLIRASNEAYIYPFIRSAEALQAECARRRSWLDSKLDEIEEDIVLHDSFHSLSFLEDLQCTFNSWQPIWKLHEAGKALVLFLHFRMFPDGLGVWTRREEGFYAVLFTLLEFPAATRVSGGCVTVGEVTLMSRAALHELKWKNINERIYQETLQLVQGVLVGRDQSSGSLL